MSVHFRQVELRWTKPSSATRPFHSPSVFTGLFTSLLLLYVQLVRVRIDASCTIFLWSSNTSTLQTEISFICPYSHGKAGQGIRRSPLPPYRRFYIVRTLTLTGRILCFPFFLVVSSGSCSYCAPVVEADGMDARPSASRTSRALLLVSMLRRGAKECCSRGSEEGVLGV